MLVLDRTSPAQEPPSLDAVLARAAASSVRFGSELQGVVAREQYLQSVRAWPGRPPTAPALTTATETRRLVSSLLLVHDPATPWQLHRDVIAVDDAAVADRQDRLTALFSGPAADPRRRLREITEESARYNLGHVTRNVNVPTFPLLVMHPSYRKRFRFSDRGRTRESGVDLRRIAFRETSRPRVVRGEHGRDVALQGLVAVDEATGELVRATITPRAGDLQSMLEVSFATVPRLPVRVPVRLWEWYWVRGAPERALYIEGEATYDDFRRYTTDVGEPMIR